jgi:peptidoglycan/LPS O-acetylase OafA/YrhL
MALSQRSFEAQASATSGVPGGRAAPAATQRSVEIQASETAPLPTPPRPTAPAAQGADLGNSAALDQWRGLALVLVLISHGFYFTNRVHGIGRVGVNLFFFISGILVFRSLAKAREATPWQRALGFWKRRLRRLYPAMASFLVAMAPIVFLGRYLPTEAGQADFSKFLGYWPFSILYLTNYVNAPISLGHLWSVSCEMQFYLLGPLIFMVGGSTTRRRFLVWGALLLLLLLAGAAEPWFARRYSDLVKYSFQCAVWPMMLGFWGEYQKVWLERVTRPWARALACLGVAMLAASLVLILFGGEMKKLVIMAGTFVMAPCYLNYLAGRSIPGWAGRGLGWIGERTYSIYMWQQPFSIAGFLPLKLHALGALVSIWVGGAWFYLFERPFLSSSRRAWIAKSPTPGA